MARERDPFRARDLAVAVVLIGLAFYCAFVLGPQVREQQGCIQAFLNQNGDTNAVRSQLVLRKERAFERLVDDLFVARTPAQGRQAKRNFDARSARIDRERAANPIQRFNDKRCDQYREDQ